MNTLLQELRQREPAFHQAELCATLAQLERCTDPHFWEVGASGTGYSRETVIAIVEERFRTQAEVDTSEWMSRRMSVWGRVEGEWRILYHEGTLVTMG